MADEKFGVENIKKVLHSAIGLGEEVAIDMEDGKISRMEALGFIDNLLEIPGVIEAAPKIKPEYDDLSEAETEDIKQYVKTEFDIPDDLLEEKIEAAFGLVAAIGNVIVVFRKKAA